MVGTLEQKIDEVLEDKGHQLRTEDVLCHEVNQWGFECEIWLQEGTECVIDSIEVTIAGIQAISSRADVPMALRALARDFARRLETAASHAEMILNGGAA